MILIKLTSHSDDSPVYININEIGHIYEVKQSEDWFQGKPIVEKYTKVGVTTHNDGGFKVKETPSEIIKKIRNLINVRII
jgi:hypothetical protein